MHFEEDLNDVDERRPLIYMWEIHTKSGELIGRYVGKAKSGAKRPRTHYARNVRNILASKPYRKGNAEGYRRVHHALAEAQRQEHTIKLRFLLNVRDGESINDVEQRCIKEQSTQGSQLWQLNG